MNQVTDLKLELDVAPWEEFPRDRSKVAFLEKVQDLPLLEGKTLSLIFRDSSRSLFKFEIYITKISETIYFSDAMGRTIALDIPTEWEMVEAISKDGFHFRQHPENPWPMSNIESLTLLVMLFSDYVEDQQMHPFVVSSAKDTTKVKNPAKRKKLEEMENTIIYLGKPPVKCKNPGTGEELQFGYPRRAHRRTLSHERYRNHPKYQVYKGVRVKQSWCGPEEYRDKVRVYKLFKRDDEF